MARLWWGDRGGFERDLRSADDERLREMRDWADGQEAAADLPGLGRNPKARRMFHLMRVAAEERLAERGVKWDTPNAIGSEVSTTSSLGQSLVGVRTRIMYIESKAAGLTGPARIARVSFSKTGRTIYYDGRAFQSLDGGGHKANYYDLETGEHYWISGPRRDGRDRLYDEAVPVDIDDDIREEYWTDIRRLPQRARETNANR